MMSRVLSRVLMVAVALLVAVSLASAAEEGKKGRRGPGQFDPFRLPSSIELTAEQKAKLDDIKKEFGEAFAAAQKKAALTDDQRRAGREAATKAREEGKSGEDIRKAMQDAQKLTDDQKKGRTELMETAQKIREKIGGILTDDQKAKLKSLKGKGKGKGKGKKAAPATT